MCINDILEVQRSNLTKLLNFNYLPAPEYKWIICLLELAAELMASEGSKESERCPFSSIGDGLAFSDGYSKVDVALSSNWIVSYKQRNEI